jgi:hypothetical protein
MASSFDSPEPTLADLLDVDADALAAEIGDFTHAGTEWEGTAHVYTGRTNPRAPERPVVVLRVVLADAEVEVGRALGVPLPDGRARWSLAPPRARVSLDDDPSLLLAYLGEAVRQVLDADMLRGVAWQPEDSP